MDGIRDIDNGEFSVDNNDPRAIGTLVYRNIPPIVIRYGWGGGAFRGINAAVVGRVDAAKGHPLPPNNGVPLRMPSQRTNHIRSTTVAGCNMPYRMHLAIN